MENLKEKLKELQQGEVIHLTNGFDLVALYRDMQSSQNVIRLNKHNYFRFYGYVPFELKVIDLIEKYSLYEL